MASVVLLSRLNVEISVSSITAFDRLVYGYGYRPKTGTIDANKTTLLAGSPPPSPDPRELVRLGDLQTAGTDARVALGAAYVAQFDITGKTSAAINAFLAAPGPATTSGKVLKRLFGSVTLDGGLVVPSKRYVDCGDAAFTLAAGLNVNMLRNTAHLTSVATAADGAMPSGSSVVTTSLAAQAVVGQSCYVANADDGGLYTLCGLVSAVNTVAGTITLVDSWGDPALAEVTVINKTVTLYSRDHDIEIVGGTWDRGNNGWRDAGVSTTADRVTFGLSRIDGITVRDVSLSISDPTQKGWNLLLADCTDYTVTRPKFNSTGQNTDGIDIHGPARNGRIERPYGTTGDDFVAFHAASSSGAPQETCGDIKDCTLVDLHPVGSGQAGLKLRASGTTKIRDIHCTAIRGSALNAIALKALGDTVNDVADVTVDLVDCRSTGVLVHLFSTTADGKVKIGHINADNPNGGDDAANVYIDPASALREVEIGSLRMGDARTRAVWVAGALNLLKIGTLTAPPNPLGTRRLVTVASGVTVGSIDIGTLDVERVSGDTVSIFDIDGTVGRFHVGSFKVTAPGGTNTAVFDLASTGATLTDLVIDGGVLIGGRRLSFTSATAGAMRMALSKFRLDGAHSIGAFASTVEFMLHGLDVESTVDTGLIRQNTGAAITVRGDGLRNPTNRAGFVGTGSVAPRVVHPQWRCDVSTLAKNDGDTANNTNAALSCGTGRAISNGTNWKNLYSGATF